MFQFGDEIKEKYEDIPKFIPTPNLDKWQGNNFYRFYHRPGALWPRNNEALWPRDFLGETGITYVNITHVAWQLAYFMGFTKILCIGMDHEHHETHFWGVDNEVPGTPNLTSWAHGYRVLREGFAPRTEIINISSKTQLPDYIIPTDDWKNYA